MLLRHESFRRLCRARELLCGAGSPSDIAGGIAGDLDEPLSVEDVARAVAMSPSHFTRQFEALFGATPHQLRIQARLERARHLLAAGRHSVTEVCMEVGFSSLGSFSGLFTRRIGATPSAYRRRMRSMIQVPGAPPPALVPGCLSLMGHLPADAFRSSGEARGARPLPDSSP